MAAVLQSALIALIAITGTVAAAQSPAFTIDDALSAPFPSGLVASPAGARVAWIFDAQGSRNIWVAERSANGSFSSRQLTRYAGDLGVEIGTIAWSSDGRALVFERGGEPNPRSLSLGTSPEQIWTMALGDTAPRLIDEGSSPAMAPHADTVAYVGHNSILLAALNGSGKPQTLVRDLGRDGSRGGRPTARASHS